MNWSRNGRPWHVPRRHAGAFHRLHRHIRSPHLPTLMLWSALLVATHGCGGTPPPATSPRAGGPSRRAPLPAPPSFDPRAQPGDAVTLRIEVGPRGSGAHEDIGLEAYVRDVVVGELSVGAADAALAPSAYEAQAIVARTYALAERRRHAADGFDLCSTTHCQVFVRDQWQRSRWASAVDAAVTRTRGQYLESAGRPIEAVFHAHCGGHTSAAAEVWRSAGATYLQGVDDPYCVREQGEAWTSTLDLETLRVALNQRPRTQVGDRLDGVQVLRRDAGGRVVEVALTGSRAPIVTGEDFRLAIMAAAGPRSLRSARFEVERMGTQVRFTGHGSGHGVGLCQIGLIGRLRAGQTPVQALLAYYPGTTVAIYGT